MTRRLRGVLYGGAAVAAMLGTTVWFLHTTSFTADQALGIAWPHSISTGCENPDVDGGNPIANLDARAEAGYPLWLATVSGNATVGDLAVKIYRDDFGNEIDSFNVAAPGAWQRNLVLEQGWTKLLFRATHKGRTVETVRWVGLATGAPTWTDPPWSTEADGSARCFDMGCVPIGLVPRCQTEAIKCSDGGCLDALAEGGGPIGCVRECHQPNGDAAICCNVPSNDAGFQQTPAYSRTGIAGLSGDVTQPSAGNKLKIKSDNSADKSMSVTVYGTRPDGFHQSENLTTNSSDGTAWVAGALKWSAVTGASTTASPAGTLTIADATTETTALTLTSGAKTKGLQYVGTNQGKVIGCAPLRVVADGATTAPVTFVGALVTGSTYAIDGVTLNGTTEVASVARYEALDWVAAGALDSGRTIDIAADEGWCADQSAVNHRANEVLFNVNFAGIQEPDGIGCGAGHIQFVVAHNKKPWPPPPLDAGYTYDAWVAGLYRKYDVLCLPVVSGLGRSRPNVPQLVAGQPSYCWGGWCCAVQKIYPDPDGGS